MTGPEFHPADRGRVAWFVSAHRRVSSRPVVGYLTVGDDVVAAVLSEETGYVVAVTSVAPGVGSFAQVTENADTGPSRENVENAHGWASEPRVMQAWQRFHADRPGQTCWTEAEDGTCVDTAEAAEMRRKLAATFQLDTDGTCCPCQDGRGWT